MIPGSLTRPLRLRPAHEPDRKTTWLELFFDLVFVAAVAQVATHLSAEYSLAGLGRFGALFLLIWWAWLGQTLFATRFDTDDGMQRALVFVQMFVVAVMAANARSALDSIDSAGFAAAYAVLRLVLAGQYFRAWSGGVARALTGRHLVGCGAAGLLWLLSAFVPTPWRFWIWGLALATDLATPLVAEARSATAPPHVAHLPERFGLFTIILLGESVVAVMTAIEHHADWSGAAAASAVLGLGLAFALWSWYFDGAGGAAERPAQSPRQARLLQLWSYAHLPLFLGIAVAGAGAEHLIVVADAGIVHGQEAWIMSGALATAMVALAVVGATTRAVHDHRPIAHFVAPHVPLAVVTLAAGVIGHLVPPVAFLALLTAAAIGQAALSGRTRVWRHEKAVASPV